jgi:hypothetical protein
MSDLLTVVLAGAALLLAAGLGALILTYLAYASGWALSTVIGRFSSRIGTAFFHAAQTAEDQFRYSQVKEEIYARIRPQVGSGGIDRQFVQAAQATKCIATALKSTSRAMETCCDVQSFSARAQGAREMAEVEWDPLCVQLRQRVVDSIDVTLECLEEHPGLASERALLKQAVALRALRQVCEDCELLKFSVSAAPALCSPAASLRQPPPKVEDE